MIKTGGNTEVKDVRVGSVPIDKVMLNGQVIWQRESGGYIKIDKNHIWLESNTGWAADIDDTETTARKLRDNVYDGSPAVSGNYNE